MLIRKKSAIRFVRAASALPLFQKSRNIYTGVCIDTDCSLGMCAERNAISTMITNGEFEIKMVAAVDKKGNVLPPCGACREFMMQLKNSADIEVLVDNKGTVLKLKNLMPFLKRILKIQILILILIGRLCITAIAEDSNGLNIISGVHC